MIPLAVVAAAGLAAGAIHVLSGPDHLAAVGPLAAGARRRAWSAGFRWGLGHAGGVLVIGVAAMALRGLVPVHALSSWSERIVGVTLIAIGLWALASTAWSIREAHEDAAHPHPHPHPRGWHGHLHVRPDRPERAALAVGLIHGSAGVAHVMGIVPALALPTRLQAAAYLVAFGIGTIAAMTAYALLVGTVGARFLRVGRTAWAGMMGTFGAASIAVGIVWLVL